MELVMFYHLECPDYVKKFDQEKNKGYLRKQVYNMLVTPYIKMKMIEKKISESSPPVNKNTLKQNKYLPYPEEINVSDRNYEMDILNDEYLKSFVDGASFTADKPKEE